MSSRVPMYALSVLLLLAVSACDATNSHGTAPSKVSAMDAAPVAISVEPAALRAEFLFDRSCPQARPFGTRVIVVVGGGEGALRSIRFRFTDRFGVDSAPRVISIPGSDPMSATIPSLTTTMPMIGGVAPLPSAAPIPIRGSSQFPFFLRLDCGVAPHGVMLIAVDTAGPRGEITTEIRARIAD